MKFTRIIPILATSVATTTALQAADYVKAYTKGTGSQLLAANGGGGSVLFVDGAQTGGSDLSADDGNPLWGWEVDGGANWALDDRVEFTGIAIPIWANNPDSDGTGNTQNGTHVVRFYSAGADDVFQGTETDTLIGTAEVNFTSADAGVDEYYVNFDAPIVWDGADSTKFFFHIEALSPDGTGTAAVRYKSGGSGPSAALKSRVDGSTLTVGGKTVMRLSVAGTVNKVESQWFGDNEDVVSAGCADWDTTSLNWAAGTESYEDGVFVIFDEGFDGLSSEVNLTETLSPSAVTVSNSATGSVPEYLFTGSGRLTGNFGLTKTGDGTLTVSNTGFNDYSGGTFIEEGVVQIGLSDALSTDGLLSLGGDTGIAEFRLNGFDQTVAGLSRLGSNISQIVNGSPTAVNLTVTGGGTYTGEIGNSTVAASDEQNNFNLVKSGSGELIVVGALNTYSGSTTITGGTYRISADGELGSVPESPVADSIVLDGGVLRTHMASTTGGSFAINENRLITLGSAGGSIQATTPSGAWVVSYNGVISGPGSLTKLSGQTLELGGDNTYTGDTIITSGTFRLRGSLDSSVSVASGLLATSTAAELSVGEIDGDLEFLSGGNLAFIFDSSTLASGSLQVSGAVSIDSSSVLNSSDAAASPVALAPGEKVTVIDYSGGSLSGSFSELPEGAELEVGSNVFTISYVDEQKVTLTAAIPDPYLRWAEASITAIDATALAGFDEDADADGVDNGLEFILGGDPLSSDSGELVSSTFATDAAVFEFNRDVEASSATALTFQWSVDLETWNDVLITTGSVTDSDGVRAEVTEGETVDAVIVTVPASVAAGGKFFGRLSATQL